MLGNIICTVKMAGVVKKERLRAGSGPTPQAGATITVHCTGSLNTNPPKKFWRYVFSNHYDSHPFDYKLVRISLNFLHRAKICVTCIFKYFCEP